VTDPNQSRDATLRTRVRSLLARILLVILLVCVFGRTVGNGWLDYDDRFHVLDNPWFAKITLDSYTHFWKAQHGNLYIPVSYSVMAFLTDVAKTISNARTTPLIPATVFHLASLACHALSTLFVFHLLTRLRASTLAAFLGAALFCIHPLQTESVAWISELRGLLATTFSLAAILVFLHPRSSSVVPGPRPTRYIVATLLFILALLSKPSAVALPLILLTLDVFLGRSVKRSLLLMLPWFAAAIAVILITHTLQPAVIPGMNETTPLNSAPNAGQLWTRPFIAADSAAFYLRKLFLPFDLTPDYARIPAAVISRPGWFLSGLIPLGLVAAAAWACKRYPSHPLPRSILLGIAVVSLALAPVLGLIPFDHQHISTVADRYMYLAMLGPAIIAASITDVVLTSRRLWLRSVYSTNVSCILIALAFLSFCQAGVWKSDVSLWSHSERVSPRSITTLNNLGFALAKAHDRPGAIERYRLALKAGSKDPIVFTNLAWELMETPGDAAMAEGLFFQALEKNEGYGRAQLGLGVLFGRQGRTESAVTHLAMAVALLPRDPQAAGNLGLALAQLGRHEEALPHYTNSLDLDPTSAITQSNMALSLRALGRTAEATVAFERATALDASMPDAWFQLADQHAGTDRLDAAAAAYRRVLAINPNHADAANNLGLVLIRLGDVDAAINAFAQSVQAAPDHPQATRNLRNARILKARSNPAAAETLPPK